MDYTAIITAALSAGVTLIVCLVNNHFQVSKTNALIAYRLEQLEKQVTKHNNLIERVYKLEETSARHDDEIARHKERLKLLEEDMK